MSIAGSFTRAAAAALPRLSFPLASSLGRGLGSLAWAIDTRHREVAMNNLRLAFPKLTESRRRQLARKAFQQAGRTAVEMLWSTSLDDRTLEEIGREFGVTRERIRQIEAKALRKLRHPSRAQRLRDYLEE